jgi:hypothetical protein
MDQVIHNEDHQISEITIIYTCNTCIQDWVLVMVPGALLTELLRASPVIDKGLVGS